MTSEKIQRTGLRRGIYVLPSLFTIGNIFCGFYAVLTSLKASQALMDPVRAGEATQLFDNAARAIGWAVLLDGLDGRIARMTGATSDFGVEFDSLADVLTFGIAPAVLAFAWAYGPVQEFGELAWIVSFMFLICGSLRLARFNVQSHKAKAPAEIIPSKLDRKQFIGLPIPAAAGMIAAIVHFSPAPPSILPKEAMIGSFHVSLDAHAFGMLMLVLVVTLGLLMISTIRHSSFKGAGPQTKRPRLTIVVIALMIICVWFYSQWSLLIIASVYAGHGLAGKLLAMVWKKPALETTPSEHPTHN